MRLVEGSLSIVSLPFHKPVFTTDADDLLPSLAIFPSGFVQLPDKSVWQPRRDFLRQFSIASGNLGVLLVRQTGLAHLTGTLAVACSSTSGRTRSPGKLSN